jgi:hypothetical protein
LVSIHKERERDSCNTVWLAKSGWGILAKRIVIGPNE